MPYLRYVIFFYKKAIVIELLFSHFKNLYEKYEYNYTTKKEDLQENIINKKDKGGK